ncbi:universal stress protein [Actinosynnema sp. NPDC004786]
MSTGPIVVGIDGTSAAERALRWAMVEATRHDIPLHVGSGAGPSAHAPGPAVGKIAIAPPRVRRPPAGTRRGDAVRDVPAGGVVPVRVDATAAPARVPLTAEGMVVAAAAVVMGSWVALGGALALAYVVLRSAHAGPRRRPGDMGRAAAGPGWRRWA